MKWTRPAVPADAPCPWMAGRRLCMPSRGRSLEAGTRNVPRSRARMAAAGSGCHGCTARRRPRWGGLEGQSRGALRCGWACALHAQPQLCSWRARWQLLRVRRLSPAAGALAPLATCLSELANVADWQHACMMSINVKEAYSTANLLVQYSSLQLQIFFPPPPPPPPPLLSPLPGNAGAVNRAARV